MWDSCRRRSTKNEDWMSDLKAFPKAVRGLAAVLLAAAFTGGLTACSQSFYGVTCNFNVQNAHQRHSNNVVMNAKATVKCNGAVNDASMEIKMQRLVNGKWADVAGTANTTKYQTIPANTSKQFNTRDVTCKSGTYRAAARGSAKLAGNKSASASWQYGNSAPISCK